MADRIIKPDSGNDVVIQNNGGTRKIEVTNAGDVEVTGDFKATTVKATNLKANDGTASLEVADSTGDIGFSGNTNLKIKLPSAGGIYESDGSTEILTESSGAVSLKNTAIDSSVTMSANQSGVKTALNATGSAGIYACRAWIRFNNTGTISITGSANVSSISDVATGDTTITFTNALPDANYSTNVTGSADYLVGNTHGYVGFIINSSAPSTTTVRVGTHNPTGGRTESSIVCVAIFR